MILSFSGRIGSGKDTAAQIVQELYPDMNWQTKGFADKLREVASVFLGIPPLDLKYQEVKKPLMSEGWDDETVRDFMVSVGMIFRGKNKNAWVNALMVGYNSVGPYKWNPGSYANTCLECTNTFYNGAKLQRFCEKCCGTVGAKFPNWLITDCRFPNEVEAVRQRDGICFRIIRPDNPYPQSTHESETAIDHIEMLTIINDGSLEQLKLRVKEAVEPIINHAKSH